MQLIRLTVASIIIKYIKLEFNRMFHYTFRNKTVSLKAELMPNELICA